jgi:hypothetical protein
MKTENALKTKNFKAWMALRIVGASTEEEALELVIDEHLFPWQQDQYIEWFQANRGWFKEAS